MSTQPLSPAELRVITLAAQGLSQRQIARQVGSTHRAVCVRLWRLRTRIGAASTAHAVALLARDGLIDLTQITPTRNTSTSTGGTTR